MQNKLKTESFPSSSSSMLSKKWSEVQNCSTLYILVNWASTRLRSGLHKVRGLWPEWTPRVWAGFAENLITDGRKQSFDRPFRCKEYWFVDRGHCVILSTLYYHQNHYDHQIWRFNVNIDCLQKPDKLGPRRGLLLCQVKRLADCFAREGRNIGHFVPALSSVSS